MQQTLTFLSPPKNQRAKLLKAMIEGNEVSEQAFGWNGFRTRISELINDWDVPIRNAWKPFVNEFGHPGKYKVHFILTVDKEACISIYEKVNNR